jgi:membrane associated rhomboid family serine protease
MDATAAPALRARAAAWVGAAPASLLLVAANVAVFAWARASGASDDPASLVRLGALERGRVWAGEPWRLVSAAFVHAGWVHLTCNVAMGLPACRLVERALGPRRFLLAYLASALAGSALSLLGQDRVAVGASGALFGVVGAVLALHLRALGRWRSFLRSGATRWLVAGILATTLVGPLFVPLDHLAHAGGLAAGAGAAWLATRPRSRRWPAAAYGAALALLVLAAAFPRAGVTRFEAVELERALHAALAAGDAPAAAGLVARADAGGLRSERLQYYRALLHVQQGDLERALALARPLAGAADPDVRAEAKRIVAGTARTLGYRLYTGDGAARDPRRGLAYLEEACSAGDGDSCRNAARIRGAR